MSNELSIWTIYDHPRDFPNSNKIMVGPDLKKLREQMEVRGLHRLPRDPRDDRKIVESWI